jgi:hypothetical protein
MREGIVSYGDDVYDDRGDLREAVFEIADGRCEHPIRYEVQVTPISAPPPGVRDYVGFSMGRCGSRATELAHIVSIGMGGGSSRDTVNNTIAACPIHARSTDDRSSPEWRHVPAPHDPKALVEWVQGQRRGRGWAV